MFRHVYKFSVVDSFHSRASIVCESVPQLWRLFLYIFSLYIFHIGHIFHYVRGSFRGHIFLYLWICHFWDIFFSVFVSFHEHLFSLYQCRFWSIFFSVSRSFLGPFFSVSGSFLEHLEHQYMFNCKVNISFQPPLTDFRMATYSVPVFTNKIYSLRSQAVFFFGKNGFYKFIDAYFDVYFDDYILM